MDTVWKKSQRKGSIGAGALTPWNPITQGESIARRARSSADSSRDRSGSDVLNTFAAYTSSVSTLKHHRTHEVPPFLGRTGGTWRGRRHEMRGKCHSGSWLASWAFSVYCRGNKARTCIAVVCIPIASPRGASGPQTNDDAHTRHLR